jgi:hypothetical protein
MHLSRTHLTRTLPVGLALALTIVGSAGPLSRQTRAAGGNEDDGITIAIRHTACPTPELLKAAPTLLKAAPTLANAASIEVKQAVNCRSFPIEVKDGTVVAPTQIESGRTLITVTNSGSAQETPEFVRLPDDVTIDDLKTGLAEKESAPAWFYTALFPGGPATVDPGQQAQTIVDLTPGRYAAFLIGSPESATEVSVVPGVQPAGTPAEPVSSATVNLQEYAFVVPSDLKAGEQIVKVVNAGDQPHEFGLSRLPDGTTLEQVQTLLTLPEGSPLPAGVPDPSQIVSAGGIGILSAGQTAWAVLDLEPGTYLALCFVPDQASGAPHVFMGMVHVFTVTA